MIFAKAVAGDYCGVVLVLIGALWSGPKAEKFRGIEFTEPKKAKYKPENIVRLVYLSEEKIKGFLGAATAGLVGGAVLGGAGLIAGALAGGNKKALRIGLEFSDGKKVIIVQEESDRAFQCLLLYAREKGIAQQDLGF